MIRVAFLIVLIKGSNMGMEMLENWVLIKPVLRKEDTTKLLGTLKSEYRGEIISVGDKIKTMKKGDIIGYLPHSTTNYQFDGISYSLIKSENIIGIIKGEENA